MSDYISADILTLFLSRLPISSILRFRCVCRRWRDTISEPRFYTLHRIQTEKHRDPENESLPIYHRQQHLNSRDSAAISFQKISSRREPITVVRNNCHFHMVGSVNGIVCLYHEGSDNIILWNPAVSRCKLLNSSFEERQYVENASVGIGVDTQTDDIKVVKIAKLTQNEEQSFHVYSSNTDSWETVAVNFGFVFEDHGCDATVKGQPVWCGSSYPISSFSEMDECLLIFNIGTKTFARINVPGEVEDAGMRRRAVEFQNTLALMVVTDTELNMVDVWVRSDDADGVQGVWSKKLSVGPVSISVSMPLYLSKDGRTIWVLNGSGKLCIIDMESSNLIKEFDLDICHACVPYSLGLFGLNWMAILWENEHGGRDLNDLVEQMRSMKIWTTDNKLKLMSKHFAELDVDELSD